MSIATVFAQRRWNSAGIDVASGDRIRVSAQGIWYDASIPSGPEGFTKPWLRPVGWTKRCRSARWFQLVAVVDKFDGPYYIVGESAEFTCQRSGHLYLFANDAWAFYFNNRGNITAEITRV